MSKSFGIQLYSVRDAAEKDYMGTLEGIAQLGYGGVEFAGFGGFSAEEISAKLEQTGLKAMGAHTGAELLSGDRLKEQLEFLAKIQCGHIICPWYDIKSLEDVKVLSELLGKASDEAQKYGIACGYHNHGQEFQMFNGEFALTHLMNMTGDDVDMELDVFWAAHSDVNPFDYIKTHHDRIRLLHLKQLDADKNSVDLPDGVIDMAELGRVAAGFGIEKLIVEQEEYAVSSMESARINAEYLNKIL